MTEGLKLNPNVSKFQAKHLGEFQKDIKAWKYGFTEASNTKTTKKKKYSEKYKHFYMSSEKQFLDKNNKKPFHCCVWAELVGS